MSECFVLRYCPLPEYELLNGCEPRCRLFERALLQFHQRFVQDLAAFLFVLFLIALLSCLLWHLPCIRLQPGHLRIPLLDIAGDEVVDAIEQLFMRLTHRRWPRCWLGGGRADRAGDIGIEERVRIEAEWEAIADACLQLRSANREALDRRFERPQQCG